MSRVLDPEIVAKIARLARLFAHPSPEFLEKYGKELGAILGYVEELQQVNVSGISPLDGLRTITIDELREDTEPEDTQTYQRVRQNIIQNFPNRQGDLLVIPGIFASE